MAKVLLIDDDVDLVQVHRTVLESRDHQVDAAYTAEEGRRKLADATPDLVVLDVMMETQTAGFELAREIHDKHPQLPILMLTGVREATGVPFKFSPEETWLPVTKFLEKPFEPTTLADHVDEMTQG
jgi:DNA-binding NtrC family response regulator